MNLWTVADEVAFMRGLTRELNTDAETHVSSWRPVSLEDRLRALGNYVLLLEAGALGQWTPHELAELAREGRQLLEEAQR